MILSVKFSNSQIYIHFTALHCLSKTCFDENFCCLFVVFQAFFLSYGLGCLVVHGSDKVKQSTVVNLHCNSEQTLFC